MYAGTEERTHIFTMKAALYSVIFYLFFLIYICWKSRKTPVSQVCNMANWVVILQNCQENKGSGHCLSLQQEDRTHQQKQQMEDQTNPGNYAGSVVRNEASSGCVCGQNNDNPIIFRANSSSYILGVIKITWVLRPCKVSEDQAWLQVGNTSRHYGPILRVGDIQMAFG